MRKALTAAQMGAVDRYMIEEKGIPSLLLMENAARGIADAIRHESQPCVVHAFCGTGNNGGDGLAAARQLLGFGYDVYVIVLGNKQKMTPDAAANFTMFEKMPARAKCVGSMDEFSSWDIPEADVIIDAIFGTGLTREVSGLQKDCIGHINEQGAFVAACDIPSGVSADTGAVLGDAVLADVTVTFQYPKIGHYLYPGRDLAGELSIVRIGVDEGCDIPAKADVFVYESKDKDIAIGRRNANTNKGDFGRLLLVAGSAGMAGAAVLGASAASAAGAGLVTVGSTDEVVSALQSGVPQVTCKTIANEDGAIVRHSVFDIDRAIKGKTAFAIGPGLGVSEDIRQVVAHAVKNYDIVKVLDADAINALAGQLQVLADKKGDVILTPHVKEFAGLIDSSIEYVLKNGMAAARAFAAEYGVTVVLKGATTVIAEKSGKVTLVCAGSPGMSKGGSGDVLTGAIAGFAAQGAQPQHAALLGVYITAMAGELAEEECGEYSMTPVDTIGCIGRAINTTLSFALPPLQWKKQCEEIKEALPEPEAELSEKEEGQAYPPPVPPERPESEKTDPTTTKRRIG